MELLILKNGELFARANDDNGADAEYTLVCVDDVPEYPTAKPEKGWYYDLVYIDGVLAWSMKERPLTTEERLQVVEEEVNAMKHGWKSGEAVAAGDRRTYGGIWYTCIQAHTTQADWTPDITPALWEAD